MAEPISLTIDGQKTEAPAGATVIAAIAMAANVHAPAVTRRSVSGMLRGPLCGMGVCHECRVTINGRQHQLSCQTLCEPGMVVETALARSAA
ncbi:(2Fe-2S)-binding protein [Pseudoduganella aquatica]|uniref:(2Fe-2S)-binding protein n=1 Tax=Pseudoduganella aquatica TaxID=2660641 RepID=A0A7X4KM32_9BURK|nr:(2Fe-2S)-binding protein [Pseudoduganella aquatica]MYN07767.1 (2Fe-2S)-binding protein [Pseudoduganella aquatica]